MVQITLKKSDWSDSVISKNVRLLKEEVALLLSTTEGTLCNLVSHYLIID